MHCVYEIQLSQRQSNLPEIIKEASLKDLEYAFLSQQAADDQKKGKQFDYDINSDELLIFRNIIYITNQNSINKLLLDEFHRKAYVTHPGYQKLLTAIQKSYFWPGLRKDVAEYLSKCLECQLVKSDHQHPAGRLQPLPIPKWK